MEIFTEIALLVVSAAIVTFVILSVKGEFEMKDEVIKQNIKSIIDNCQTSECCPLKGSCKHGDCCEEKLYSHFGLEFKDNVGDYVTFRVEV